MTQGVEPDDKGTDRGGLVSALTLPIAVLLGVQLAGGMMLSSQRTFFPVYAKELGHSALLISALAAVRLAMGMVASLVGGTLSDLLGRKWTLLLGNLGFLVGSLVFLTPSAGWLGLLWALSGFGSGLHTLGGQSYLVDASAPRYLGVFAALYNWGFTLGGALSSPAAGFVLDRWGYAVFAGALAALALSTVAANAFLLPRVRASQGDLRASRNGARASGGRLLGYGDIAARPQIVALTLLRFLPTVYWGVAAVFMPLLLDAAGANKVMLAWYAMTSQAVASLAQLVVGRAADRFGARWPTVITFCVLTVGILGTGLLPGQLWSIFVFGVLGAAAAWSFSTLLPTLVARVTPPAERGRVLGWIHLWWNAAMVAGSMLGGALYERGAGLPFLVTGALNLVSIGLAWSLFRQVDRARGTKR